MNKEEFDYLSATAVARLSYEERQKYYRNLIDAESESDDAHELTGDENMDGSSLPANEGADSDAKLGQFEVEIADDSDTDVDEAEDVQLPETAGNDDFFPTKDGMTWNKQPRPVNRQGRRNIIKENAFMGPNPTTKNLSKVEIFKCIFDEPIRDIICRYTNKKAESVYTQWNATNPDKQPRLWKNLSDEELLSFLWILLVSGCHISSKEPVYELWHENSYPLYRATMARNRFQEILRFLRFYWHATRDARLETDKAAPITDMFQMLNGNLMNFYRPHESVTVDEQLYGYRGRTRFTQYMPSKPAKYGIKIWWVCDSKTFYPLQGQIYTGKINNARETNQGARVVKDLVAPYKGSGRNVCTDNFFSSLPLAKELDNWNMTLVGTLKKNKPYVPVEFKTSKEREVESSLFGFSENNTLCSYVPAKNKTVVLLSSMHRDAIISGPKHKPEIIMYYNENKGGVDVMDKMLSQYTTKRATSRWPLAMFFNLLDVAALASFIIYKENNPGSTKSSQRRLFTIGLAEDLCLPSILSRSKNKNVTGRFYVRSAMDCILGKPIQETVEDEIFEADEICERDSNGRIKMKGKCYMCYNYDKAKRNTRQCCITCKKPLCAMHSLTQTKCEYCYVGPSQSRKRP